MRIIHCADLHLDSRLESNLGRETAKTRKGEILNTFTKMIDYACKNDVSVILISGDLFDKNKVSSTAANTVRNAIITHPEITFFYLKGNHDSEGLFTESGSVPQNLKLFGNQWISYPLSDGKITITGIEINEENRGIIYSSLLLNNSDFNIVMLHGQEGTSNANTKDRAEIINLKQLKNKSIDYLALGHIHFQKIEKLDARGIYCYPGCLEGRGFDECGEHGFMMMDIDTDSLKYTLQFTPFAFRKLFALFPDISGCRTSAEIISVIENEISDNGCLQKDLLKIVLKGNVAIDCEKDLHYIASVFADRFFFVKILDETAPLFSAQDYLLDTSLKGEFVRNVLNNPEIDETDKPYIIKIGIEALMECK